MRVAVVTAGSADYEELSAVTTPTKQRYAEKHGYDFFKFQVDKQMGDACKREAYNALLGAGYDLFFWIDMDAMIMNSDISVESLCEQFMPDTCHFLWSFDNAGPNSGVYLARYTPQGRHFMDRAYATMLENGLADETAMEMTMVVPPFADWVKVIPGYYLNAYDYRFYGWDKYGEEHGRRVNMYEPGCFILHFPGYANEQRIPELQRRLAEAV